MTKKKLIPKVLRIFLLLAIPLSITFLSVQYQQSLPGSRKVGAGSVKAAGATTVPQYEKFELTYPSTGNYSNPNDPAQVDVEVVFTAPSGHQQTVPGFFFQGFTRSGSVRQEILTQVPGSDSWKIRYAPSEIGSYTYTVTLKDPSGTTTLDSGSFTVVPSSNPGFIRAAGLHFERNNGQQFIPLGVNAPWFGTAFTSGTNAWGDGTYGVDAMYQQFMANGANFFHLWTCSWLVGNAKPWAKPNIGCDSSSVSIEQMSQPDSWDMDYMVDQAHLDNIYLIPILKHRDQQHFTYADQIKARYFVARWGYSTDILAWDFEKEGASSYRVNHAWASYMNSIDPYQHLRTTSEGNHYPVQNKGNLLAYNTIFGDPLMTLVQNHDYTGDCTDDFGMDSALALFYMKLDPSGTDPRDIHHFNKPSFFGETGVHVGTGTPCHDNSKAMSPYYNSDTNGLIMKSEIWGTLMGSACGCAPWYFRFSSNGTQTQYVAFKGASVYAAALPPVPDSANLFTTYNDTSQATVSDARLRLIGRKTSTFAMLFVQNTTGTWGAILRNQTPTPVAGTISLFGMQPNTTFTIKWYDTDAGAIIWQTPLKVLPSDFLYGATTIFNGSVYISVASIGDCKPVPGRIVQVEALTGTIQHTFSDMPGSCLGGGVWGSPVINTTTGILFFATGNAIGKCSQLQPLATALIALNAGDLSLVGSWQIPPSQLVTDSDFGSTPTLFQATINNVVLNMVGVVNKNGIYYAFNQANISAGPLWQVQLAVGGAPDLGYGSISASAWDGTTLYAAGGYTTINGKTCPGSVRALDPASGKFLWEVCLNKAVLAAVTAVPGVVEVGSGPFIIVLRASDGTQLFNFHDKASSRFWGPASISNGVLYQGNMNGNFYAFGL